MINENIFIGNDDYIKIEIKKYIFGIEFDYSYLLAMKNKLMCNILCYFNKLYDKSEPDENFIDECIDIILNFDTLDNGIINLLEIYKFIPENEWLKLDYEKIYESYSDLENNDSILCDDQETIFKEVILNIINCKKFKNVVFKDDQKNDFIKYVLNK